MALKRIDTHVFDDATSPPRLVACWGKGSWRELVGGELVVVESPERAAMYGRLPVLPYVHPVDAAVPARRLGKWGPGALERVQAALVMAR
jgi:hypothetical protein